MHVANYMAENLDYFTLQKSNHKYGIAICVSQAN